MEKPPGIKIIGTRAQWLEIAEAFECEPEKRTKKQRRITWEGLCYAVFVCLNCQPPNFMADLRRIFCPSERATYAYWFRLNRAGDFERAKVARQLAEWCEEK